ncbi:dihydrofolate reductase [Pseudoflavitalea sp. G-6-1-2]|uniref:dihydrofolate reductase family protein n=1 Tax=Pseudoflavitalea sp. G-6-1-2 TaxID=2728841 RepID=UPI00146DBEFD|nr:dihydrofolate reductase family protein [Pseudoflavitalea sp. G-6-1-2]NML22307.1 dihydrofolate reductase [Pseudoflavitalea sp. G-6-1-2]
MRRIVLSLHTSMDGYAGGVNGEMDWLKIDDTMFDYVNEFTEEADTALYGRVTYDMMQAYWPTAADKPNATLHDRQHSAWYKKVEKLVVSRTLTSAPDIKRTVLNNNWIDQIRKKKEEPGKNIIIFGSPSIGRELMQHNLIDDYWFFVNPMILGDGINIFPKGISSIPLKLNDSKRFPCGVEALHFTVHH